MMLNNINKDQISIRILETTRKLSETGGITNVNMHQIAKQANIGQATLYRRYKSLEEILLDILTEDVKLLKKKVSHYNENSIGPTLNQIIFFFECLIEFNEKGYQQIGISDTIPAVPKLSANNNPPKLSYFSSPIYPWLHQTLRELLEKHFTEQQTMNQEIDFTTHSLLSTLHMDTYIFLRNNYTVSQIKNNLYTIIWKPILNQN